MGMLGKGLGSLAIMLGLAGLYMSYLESKLSKRSTLLTYCRDCGSSKYVEVIFYMALIGVGVLVLREAFK